MEKVLKELLIRLGIRGLMTCLGFRKTTGSQDLPWPTKASLLASFNKLNTILSEEELKRMKHPSRLTVGARAFCKHAYRSSEGFWGIVKGTEAEKNAKAEACAKSIVDECIWVNAHILPHSEHIIEVSFLLSECAVPQQQGLRYPVDNQRGVPRLPGASDGRRPRQKVETLIIRLTFKLTSPQASRFLR